MHLTSALVVDDDSFQCELTKDILRQSGVSSVAVATSGADALKRLGQGLRPQLIICDLHMPGMDGFEFMAVVAKMALKAQFLIASGQQAHVLKSAGLMARLHDLPCLGIVEKPLSRDKLRQALMHAPR